MSSATSTATRAVRRSDASNASTVVALFADISGFTAMSEALAAPARAGTEELTDILNRYFEPMIALVQSFGGIIGKFGGDAMTVLFPLRRSQPQRHRAPGHAVRAGDASRHATLRRHRDQRRQPSAWR